MTNRIQLKRTANVSSIPSASDLEYGELALNYADGTLYFKNSANAVTLIANASGVDVDGNVITDSQVITNVVANNNGNSITIVGDFLPAANEVYNLGSDSLRWKEMHLSGNTIYIGGIPISALAGAVQINNFQTNTFQVNSVPIAADANTGTITVNNQELITQETLTQTPYVQLAEAQNRHQVYKIASIDNFDYAGVNITTMVEVADSYGNAIVSNAAIYINDFRGIYEFYPNSNSTTLLTNVFSGLTVINNADDILYKWDGDSNTWVIMATINAANANITGNVTANYFVGNGAELTNTGSKITIANTVPSNPNANDTWVDSETGIEYVYFTDEDSSQWVQMASRTATRTEYGDSNVAAYIAGENINLGNTSAKHFLPAANATYDLGSPTFRWNTLFLVGNTIDIGGASIKSSPSDGTIALIPQLKTGETATKAMVIGQQGIATVDTESDGTISDASLQEAATNPTTITANLFVYANASVYNKLTVGTIEVNSTIIGYATTSYVDTEIAKLVNSAPETLDTLNELASALGYDPNLSTTLTGLIANNTSNINTLRNDTNSNLTTAIDKVDANIITNVTAINANIATLRTDTDSNLTTTIISVNSNVANLEAELTANTQALTTAIATAESNSTAYTDSAISNLIGNAPATLDTLNEIATALGENANLSETLTSLISNNTTLINTISDDLVSNVTAINSNVANVSTELTANTAQLSSDIANVSASVESLETQVGEDLANTIANLNANITSVADDLVSNVTAINSNLAQLRTDTDSNLTSAIDEVDSNIIANVTAINSNLTTATTAIYSNIATTRDTLQANISNLEANAVAQSELINANIRNSILLTGGFVLLTEGNVTGNRTEYSGSLVGETTTSYYYDSSDDSWYDASTGGNLLIGF